MLTHARPSQPSSAAAAQGETPVARSPTGCKALEPQLGKLGWWWNQASEQTFTLTDMQGDTGVNFVASCLSFSEGRKNQGLLMIGKASAASLGPATDVYAPPLISPTDGVSLKMIEDLKAMIDNISQEVALLKEKQALQTGKGLAEEDTAFALRVELLIKQLQSLHVF